MDTVVKTTHGQLRGSLADGVHCFLGIPFAASTAGVNRLRPPQPVQPWSGVRDAMKYGDSPFQLAPPESAGTEWDTALAGEDCLNLNVWTPDPGNGGLPVMVWIQGGAFEIGSTASYNGRTFARDGVICVVINWRVGADGFLDLGDGQANIGLLDQLAALEWVRDNIAAFGGDPANVTVFGQSAGAMSIGVLLSMPRAEGLFRRAILQSGAAHHVLPTETAQRIGGFLSEKLGVSPTREAMAAVPVHRFLAAQTELKADLAARPDPARWGPEVVASSMLWQPSVDGDVIPRRPIERIAAGAGSTVDVMIGSNAEDWKLFLAITGVIAKVTERDLAESRSVDGFPPIGVYGLPPRLHCASTGPTIRPVLPASCLPLWKPTGGCGFRRYAWRMPMRKHCLRRRRVRTCTNLPGLPRALAQSTPWRCRSFSTPWTRAPGSSDRCLEQTRRRNWLMPCTPRGFPSPLQAIRAGPATISSAAPPCCSIPAPESSTTPGHGNGTSGRASARTRRRGSRSRCRPPRPSGRPVLRATRGSRGPGSTGFLQRAPRHRAPAGHRHSG